MPAAPLSRAEFAETTGVSRETLDRLQLHLDLLERWQRRINLVGRATLADPWRRHMLDSAQLLRLLPAPPGPVVDLGSGAGFPGLVLAICGVPGMHLIESDRRKAEFLREVVRQTGAPAEIHVGRIEQMQGWPAGVVTARALAPLPRLLSLAGRFLGPGSTCLFLKGASAHAELTEAARHWHIMPALVPSLSDPSGVVLQLKEVGRASDCQS